ncbi:hypothetical protein Leryth_011228 [Lithospermum erythrorhizon]|nr:hypothetical protein Leryth_011228 [Lithospermum erythrorhizon]
MGDENDSAAPIRLMNFVSEEQLEESKKNRGARVEDGTAQRGRPLFEILRENKDKKDAEFNERFKHRPPKALDEDETEFLDNLEMSRKEYEQKLADQESQELMSFQAAVAAQSVIVQERQETPPISKVQDKKVVEKKMHPRPYAMIVKVKPQAKKAKIGPVNATEPLRGTNACKDVRDKSSPMKIPSSDTVESRNVMNTVNIDDTNHPVASSSGLVSYSDESEEED